MFYSPTYGNQWHDSLSFSVLNHSSWCGSWELKTTYRYNKYMVTIVFLAQNDYWPLPTLQALFHWNIFRHWTAPYPWGLNLTPNTSSKASRAVQTIRLASRTNRIDTTSWNILKEKFFKGKKYRFLVFTSKCFLQERIFLKQHFFAIGVMWTDTFHKGKWHLGCYNET